MTVSTAKSKFYAVAGGFIQQKEVADIGILTRCMAKPGVGPPGILLF